MQAIQLMPRRVLSSKIPGELEYSSRYQGVERGKDYSITNNYSNVVVQLGD